jgi:hypothetical protein
LRVVGGNRDASERFRSKIERDLGFGTNLVKQRVRFIVARRVHRRDGV